MTGSALPSGTIETIEKDLGVRDPELLVLPVSIYLIGYILGPVSSKMGRPTIKTQNRLVDLRKNGLIRILNDVRWCLRR